MINYAVVEAETELQERLAAGGCRVAAGMTDMYPSGQMSGASGTVLDISRVPTLRGISCADGVWRVGATTSWRDLLTFPWSPGLAMLAEVSAQVGAVQVQNAATVGGNLCNASPAADGVPVLMALNASVELCSSDGIRVLPLSDFITGVRRTALRDGEYLRAVIFPDVKDSTVSAFVKLGLRRYLVISIAMAAGQLRLDDDGRVAGMTLSLGACSPVAARLPLVEAAVVGQPVSPALVDAVTAERVAPAIQPIDDVRASAAYRSDAAVQVVRDTVAHLVERAT